MINNDKQEIKNRFEIIRFRTLFLTATILITLIFFFLVNIGKSEKFDVIEFILICIVQLLIYYIYFPDGDLFGQTNAVYILNKQAYNEKATLINQSGQINKLREYCVVEYEERKKRYIKNYLGYIGITEEEFEILKQKDEKFIKNLKSYEFKNGERSKLVFFNKLKRKNLYNLVYKKIPVEQNFPETIMSATENYESSCIKDGSSRYKKLTFFNKFLKVIMIGAILAYISYTFKDGIGISEITQILTYLTAIISNAIMSFNAGEKCSKVYKNQFYVELSNFIDEFNEYTKRGGI